jgi:DUF4097 and DUF4098 domain-containing protein YvlB
MRNAGTLLSIFLAGAILLALSDSMRSRVVHAQSRTNASDSGPVIIHKMGGGIEVKDAPHGANLNTMGGDIHIGSVSEFAKARTMGGNVTIDHANGPVDASTMGGSITVKDATGPIVANTMAGDITARLVRPPSGGCDIHLSSKSGTITLIVPKDFPMEVRIQLAFTKNAGRTFDVIDHIGLTKRESADWDTSPGTPRKYIYAEGRVAGGQNHVRIDTINGDVILKQE